MYYSVPVGVLILLLPVILLGVLIAIGIVLYRHPSKLQKKWYQVSYKKRKRVKQAAVLLGFCMIIAVAGYTMTWKDPFTSNVDLSAKEMNFATADKIKKAADPSSNETGDVKEDRWLKSFYQSLASDELIFRIINDGDMTYNSWKSNLTDQQTGEHEIRMNAENAVVEKSYAKKSDEDEDSDEGFNNYDEEGFYYNIQRSDRTFEENYQNLKENEKKQIQNLTWHYKDGLLYATNTKNKICINGAAQYFMKDTKLINSLENGGYRGIKQWMKDCENKQDGIKVKAGNKTYLFHNTDKWYQFKKNGVTFLYNYKRFVMRFDVNKVLGIKSNISDLPQQGRELWSVVADHTGESYNEMVLRSYNNEDLYAKKQIKIFFKDHEIKQMLIYWNDSDELKGFTKEENIFVKACFNKMGISTDEAERWFDTFTFKKQKQSGKLGRWTYQQGKSKSQFVSMVINDNDENYVNFYKKSKGNN